MAFYSPNYTSLSVRKVFQKLFSTFFAIIRALFLYKVYI